MYANKVDQKAPMDQDGAEEMKGFDVRRRRGAGGAAGMRCGAPLGILNDGAGAVHLWGSLNIPNSTLLAFLQGSATPF